MDRKIFPETACASRPPVDTASREIDAFFESDSEQMGRMTGVMRRVEDLADRVAGAQPSGDSDSAPQRDGVVGVLRGFQATRDQIIERIASAMDRIDRVL